LASVTATPLPSFAARGVDAHTSGTATGTQRELPGVASQLLNTISPLRLAPNGAQSVTISLHPAELGEVHVAMNVLNGQMTVRMTAATPEGAAAIRSSLGDLQSQLSENGQSATVLLDGNGLSGGQYGAGQQTWTSGQFAKQTAPNSASPMSFSEDASEIVATPSSSPDHLIDIRT